MSLLAESTALTTTDNHPLFAARREESPLAGRRERLDARPDSRPHRPNPVVLMKPLLGDALDTLRARVEQASSDPLIHGLAGWFGLTEPRPASTRPAVRTYQHVALLGLVAQDGDGLFLEGVEWLRDCRFFKAGVPPGFEADPLAIFAVGIGLSKQPDDIATSWLSSLVKQAIGLEHDPWRRGFLLATLRIMGEAVDWGSSAPELPVALESRGYDELDTGLREQALAMALKLHDHDERAVVQLAALEHLLAMAGTIDVNRPSVGDVVAILKRVPAAMKRWPWESAPKTRKEGVTAQKWDLQVEDHVQALLYAILRPVFTDIDDEEYLKSLGHKRPRADFVIPSLHLVVEVKFLRKSTQRARGDTIEQVSADTGLYLNDGTPYDNMVAFVWDDTGSVNHHAELEAGLTRLPGVVAAIIVARPGSWKRVAKDCGAQPPEEAS